MRGNFKWIIVCVLLLALPVFAWNASHSGPEAAIDFAQKAAVAAVNFRQGDQAGFSRSRADFTADGWKDFLRHNQGFLDQNGAPTFTSTFVPSAAARILGEQKATLHLRIPGTLTQSNNLGRTIYRAALDVVVGGTPAKIEKLEQITCAGASAACQ